MNGTYTPDPEAFFLPLDEGVCAASGEVISPIMCSVVRIYNGYFVMKACWNGFQVHDQLNFLIVGYATVL